MKQIPSIAAVAVCLLFSQMSWAQSGGTGMPSGSLGGPKPTFAFRDNQTALLIQQWFGPISSSRGSITVTLNGKAIPQPKGNVKWLDVSSIVRPGKNTFIISASNTGAVVTFSHAEKAGRFRRIVQIRRRKKELTKPQSFSFVLPGSTQDASSGTSPQAGSANKQLILRIEVTKPVAIFINGRKIGDFQNVQTLDIGNFARRGSNTLSVSWKETGTRGLVRVAYAVEKNKFRDIGTVRIQGAETRRAGQEKLTFRRP
jgi:hypothetical protein